MQTSAVNAITIEAFAGMKNTKITVLLSLLACGVASIQVRPDVSTTDGSPTLEQYLCNGSLYSNSSLTLHVGIYKIPAGPICVVSDLVNVQISGVSMEETIVYCNGDRGFHFAAVTNLTIERLSFVGCGQTSVIKAYRWIFQLYELYSSNKLFCSGLTPDDIHFFDDSIREYEASTVLSLESSADVSVREVKITQHEGFGIFGYKLRSRVQFTRVQFSDCRHNNCSGALISQTEVSAFSLIIESCSFINMIYSPGASLNHFSAGLNLWGQSAIVSNTVFMNNVAPKGSSIVTLLGSVILLTNVRVEDNGNTDSWSNCEFTMGTIACLVTESVIVKNSTFAFNRHSYIGAALTVALSSYVEIANSVFHDNDAKMGGAVMLFEFKKAVVQNCTFASNTAVQTDHYDIPSVGGAICLMNYQLQGVYSPDGELLVSHSMFFNNSATIGGAMVIAANNTKVTVSSCSFISNSALWVAGAIGGVVTREFNINKSEFIGNKGGVAGGGMAAFVLNDQVTIKECTFISNTAITGGAVVIMFGFLVSGNSASSLATFYTNQSTFIANEAFLGAAVYVTSGENTGNFQTCEVVMTDVLIADNYCRRCTAESADIQGAAVFINQLSEVHIGQLGNENGTRFVRNGPKASLEVRGGKLHLWGRVTFEGNYGDNGGAVRLLQGSEPYFHEGCDVTFVNNTATRFGGALYIEGDPTVTMASEELITKYQPNLKSMFNPKLLYLASYCAIHFVSRQSLSSVSFTYNHAGQTGHSIYATPLYKCLLQVDLPNSDSLNHDFVVLPDVKKYFDLFKINSLPNDSTEKHIVSFPISIQISQCDSSTECNISQSTRDYHITTYPGKTVRFQVSSVDYMQASSPSIVYTEIDSPSGKVTMGTQEYVQWISEDNHTMEYHIYGPENTSLSLVLTISRDNTPTIIRVNLKPCDIGFEFNNVSLTCQCLRFLETRGIFCDVTTATVTRSGNQWIGAVITVDGGSFPAFVNTCPVGYCVQGVQNIILDQPDVLCSENRTGVLCGRCSGNTSAVFGSTECRQCSNAYLLTLLMYGAVGVALVAALFLLNLTVTRGTLYGIVFYANAVIANRAIIFYRSDSQPLRSFAVVMSLINLDLGFPLCFYDGMDAADKTGLQFVFPLYLLLLTVTIIGSCQFCCHYSSGPYAGMRRPWLNQINRFFGSRVVSVLATLIYLSYYKMLRTVIEIFTAATVFVNDGTSFTVWFTDGTTEYLTSKHTVLFVSAVLMSVLLLMYTTMLSVIPLADRFSEHHRCLDWISKKMSRLKPFNDAYYAPFKGECRAWFAARLWFLVILSIPNTVIGSDNPSLLFFIHAVITVIVVSLQLAIQPFGATQVGHVHSVRKVLTCCNSALLLNWLDVSYLLNYLIFSISLSYLYNTKDYSSGLNVCVSVSVGLAIAEMVFILVYHFIFKAGCVQYKFTKPGDSRVAPVELVDNSQSLLEADDDVLEDREFDDSQRWMDA